MGERDTEKIWNVGLKGKKINQFEDFYKSQINMK